MKALPQIKAGETVLVTGPARSGKSEWAEQLAAGWSSGGDRTITYIATAQTRPDDAEWNQRIDDHRRRRPSHWHLREVPDDLTPVLRNATAKDCLLIDSLGTWLANTIEWEEERWRSHTQAFLTALNQCPAAVIFVAEETGWGVVPAYPMGRSFRDRLGLLTRTLGQTADAVYLATAGHILPLHQLGYPIGISSRLTR